jgi:hypothetical protein
MCIDHTTGACSNPAKPDATACDDGDPQTLDDVCRGGRCAGIANPCLTDNGGCSPNATCAFTPGSQTCTCNTGFTGDGVTCTTSGGGGDTTAPTLTAFSFAPTSIDTSSGDATVTVSFSATDDLSGVSYAFARFASPSGAQFRDTSCTVVAGHATSATITCAVTFQAFGEAGTWAIAYVALTDVVGNNSILRTSDLTALGFQTTLGVSSNQDTTAPTLTAFSFAPTSLRTE